MYKKHGEGPVIHVINEDWPNQYKVNGTMDVDALSMQWIPMTEAMNYVDTWYMNIYYQGDMFWNYCYSFYYGILFMTQNEIAPKESSDILLSLVLLLGGLLINSLVLSKIAVLLSKIQSKKIIF